MSITFGAWWPLILLLAIPYLWWVKKQSVTDLTPSHLKLSTILRSCIVVLLAFALMQPVLFRAGTDFSVVYLIDLSQSVSAPAIQAALDWIGKTNESGKPSHTAMIPFAANSQLFDTVDAMKKVQISSRPIPGAIDQSATNIQDAIDRGLRSLAPHHLQRLVLVSDGNENAKKMMDLVPRLNAENVHVYTIPLQTRSNRDAWVENILAPTQVTAEESFPVEVHAYSQTDAACEISVKNGSKTLDTRKVQLTRGLNRVSFEPRIDAGGSVTLLSLIHI